MHPYPYFLKAFFCLFGYFLRTWVPKKINGICCLSAIPIQVKLNQINWSENYYVLKIIKLFERFLIQKQSGFP